MGGQQPDSSGDRRSPASRPDSPLESGCCPRIPWRIWVDTGGTFTDAVALSPAGELARVKILSTSALRGRVRGRLGPRRIAIELGWRAPASVLRGLAFRLLGAGASAARVAAYDPQAATLELDADWREPFEPGAAFELASDEEAPVLAARLITGTAQPTPLPTALVRLATTLGTNALLERRGAPTALFVTRGFADLLRIGTQQRPDLFRLDAARPAPLHDAVVEVAERIDARGVVLRPIDVGGLEPAARALVERGVRAAAVALVHSWRNPAHERTLVERLRAWGFGHVAGSAELAPRIKLVPRAGTAVVDARLGPLIHGFLARVEERAPDGALLVMTSAGGLVEATGFRARDSLLSGPAGGVVGAARAAKRAGHPRGIGFDMGGTSTDVARFDGEYEYRYEHRVGDAEIAAPALAIESVASGGGSVCWLDGERLRVGPLSAGAHPGPACYGAGGPLTLTDANLLLGRLDPSRFEIPVDAGPARSRLDELLDDLARRTQERPAARAVLEGLVEVADETMADAIRRISVRRGYDPAEYALVAFGGAGGQHACGVAGRLGMRTIVIPPDAGLLSALGLGHAVVERFAERQVLEPVERAGPRLTEWFEGLGREALRAVVAAGVEPAAAAVRRRSVFLRYVGQETSLEVEYRPGLDLGTELARRHLALYGHQAEHRAVEVEAIRAVASSPQEEVAAAVAPARVRPAGARRQIGALAAFDREDLAPGAELDGPALVLERHGATFVAAGWNARVHGDGALILERGQQPDSPRDEERPSSAKTNPVAVPAVPEAVRLELFTRRFTSLVEEMGERLERTAVSTNVKERLDFSCALLDPAGELVVNAPHIPVHLGALGVCVRSLRQTLELRPGDVAVTNHPAFGGSHLPDVTVVTPVFTDAPGERLLGFVASRAHHAEIGGSRPGSMPPAATTLAEEGVVVAPTLLIERGRPRWDELRRLLTSGPWPSRAVEDNLADLRAAAAANHAGSAALRALAKRHGADVIHGYMERLERLADARIREALRALGDGVHAAEERLDDGTPLSVRVEIREGRACIDFTGTGGPHPGNLNATPAIVRSVVIYVLRLLLREPLPLNEGLLRAVDIRLPRPSLLDPPFGDDPQQAPAVVGGNVETSQRLVDTLIKALGLAACSQGTMNNVIFGGAGYGYYETLGGGCGAGPGFHGASAVHSHMTNTRITDPEVLEHRYPVRLERFAVRAGSGGVGRFRGGDGIVREITFLEPAELSLLTQHRTVAPYGLAGGAPGSPGAQRVIRASGEVVALGPIDGCTLAPGDRLIVETPGGGGWGEVER